MKEILYIQAGSLANYVGTHFWNTQETYFTYGDDEEPIVVHDMSFREGLTSKNEPILCPRLLAFDRKANFGTLSQSNALFDASTEVEAVSPWSGSVVEYRQDPIPKSRYQERMDEEMKKEDENEVDDADDLPDSDIRFWSDFSRLYHIPRTMQRLPDVADWENGEGDWVSSQETFQRHNEESALMEESLRLFVEECDLLQGIQILNDTATFGGFTDSFLSSFRDDFAKLPSLTFPLLSNAIPGRIDIDDLRGIRKAVNDALCLRGLNELSSMTVPIQSPSTWQRGVWDSELDINRRSMYHTSALLSAHIESSTLPLRMKGTNDDLSSFGAQLNWRGTTRFAQLSGIFPFVATSAEDIDTRMFDFSIIPLEKPDRAASLYAQRDVLRGFDQSDVSVYDAWRGRSSLTEPLYTSTPAPAYPIPTSFPSFFKSPLLSTRRGVHAAPRSSSTKVLSSLSTGGTTSSIFSAYATFVEECVRRRTDVGVGLDVDELKDLANDLWTVVDGFAVGDSAEIELDDGLGEDEE